MDLQTFWLEVFTTLFLKRPLEDLFQMILNRCSQSLTISNNLININHGVNKHSQEKYPSLPLSALVNQKTFPNIAIDSFLISCRSSPGSGVMV